MHRCGQCAEGRPLRGGGREEGASGGGEQYGGNSRVEGKGRVWGVRVCGARGVSRRGGGARGRPPAGWAGVWHRVVLVLRYLFCSELEYGLKNAMLIVSVALSGDP